MSGARFSPAPLCGAIDAPASKSDAHRLLIAAALSDAPCRIENAGDSDDIRATARCLCALGAKIIRQDDALFVEPIGQSTVQSPELDCGESGSTLRFLLPVAAACARGARFTARGGLCRRPLDGLLRAMAQNGAESSAAHAPLTLSGALRGGTYTLAGNVSSQYISGLLFALPLLQEDSRIILTTPLSSAGYVDMTLDVLSRFGVRVQTLPDGYFIPANQTYRAARTLRAEGDWSGAAFFLCAGALHGPVTVRSLRRGTLQTDAAIVDVLRRFGAQVCQEESSCTIRHGTLRGITVDADAIPDLVPPIAALAAFAQGRTRIENCARLRIKESDRLLTVCTTLESLGARAQIDGDALVVHGGSASGGAAQSFGDHRIAMAAALIASAARGESTLDDPAAVRKSYPAFYRDYQKLGGKVYGIELW